MKRRTKKYENSNHFNSLLKLICVFVSLSFSNYKNQETKPNVIFILVDDLGFTDLSSYGSDYYQTPNIDKLVSKGVKFTNAYAASNVCSPTRASIITGKYPATLQVTDFIPGKTLPNSKLLPPKWQKYLDTTHNSMAKIFKANGYVTAHIGKWHLGKDSMYWPENHGFDINIGGWSNGAPVKNKNKNANGYFSPYGNPKLKDGKKDEYLTERLAKEAKNFIEQNHKKPFFLNLWFYSVHTPLQAKKEKVFKYRALLDSTKNHKNPVYAAMIEHMDEAIGEVFNTLKKLKIDNNTIIVFTSDNGGLVGNHERFTEKVTSNYPLRSGKGDIYEGGTRVPCVIYYPNKIKPHSESTPIISTDFLPTLIDLAELKKADDYKFEGVSLASLLTKKAPLKKRSLFWHYPHYHTEGAVPYSAIRFNEYKLIHDLETDSLELYNLEKDIGETNNLSTKNKKVTKELFTKLQQWKKSVKAQKPIVNTEYIK